MLTLLYLLSRRLRPPGAPAKRVSRGRRRLFVVLRYADGVLIVGGLFGLAVALIHSDLLFILLPTALSVAIIALTMRSHVANLRALLFTSALALAYFALITGWELLTHQSVASKIILVTTTLAAAVMLEPLRTWVQSTVEQRFDLVDDKTSRIVDAFTTALREEIDLDQVREHFSRVVRRTMQPRFVSLWVRMALPEDAAETDPQPATPGATEASIPTAVAVADGDPLAAYALAHPGVVEVARVTLDSPAIRALKAREAELALPLVSQGELIGLLALGARQDGDDYSRDDRRLLVTLAAQVAPALRVAQMVRTRQAEVRERERIEQELRTAQQIQRTFLPKDVPELPGWQLVSSYQPAREVGGDFYDFLPLDDGRLGIVLGDVTGKGIPAALVMTAARTMLRTAAQEEGAEPDGVLARVNDLLHADIPAGMFVTCFYALLDPTSSRLRYANAGQDLPYRRRPDGSVSELRATGMPLGLLPGSTYDTHEATLAPDESLLFFSDGLVEAHNPAREMFGLPRVTREVAVHADGAVLIGALLDDLKAFTGPGWEQEDDVTLVALRRTAGDEGEASAMKHDPPETAQTQNAGDNDGDGGGGDSHGGADGWRTLADFSLPSEPGGEREAIARVTAAVAPLHLAQQRLERLQTAVGEATMNAMEHGNHYRTELPVAVSVRANASELVVRVTDHGSHTTIPPVTGQTPDLAAKLAGEQSPRGWGLFLMRSLVDTVRVSGDATHHTVELVLALG
ncbi:MAG TPA: SpoIIE family protein phosphatase [Ktedonobacterales bacterium]